MLLIIGATGNVGRKLTPLLIDRGERVRVLVRNYEKAKAIDARAEAAVGDLDRPETLGSAMADVRAIYLVAFQTTQIECVVHAAKAAGVARIVRQSTI